MDADDVEALLAGLSDNEGPSESGQSAQSQPSSSIAAHDSYNSIENRIASETTALKQFYAKHCPIITQMLFTPRQLVQLIRLLGPQVEIAGDTQTKLVEVVGNDNTVRLSIALTERSRDETVSIDSIDYDNLLQRSASLESLLDEREALLTTLASDAPTAWPNLATLLSPQTIALLILRIGSIGELALMPPTNLVNPATSALAQDQLIIEVPHKFQRQALRILAGKVTLAARLDTSSPTKPAPLNPISTQWKRNIDRRISKLLAPPPSVQERALPKPTTKKTSRRGGKRIRLQKQKRMAGVKPEFVSFGN